MVFKIPMIPRYFTCELIKGSILCVTGVSILLLYGNLSRYEQVFLDAFSHSYKDLYQAIILLVPYVCSMAIPFGYSLALALVIGRFSSDLELIALKSLGINTATSIFLPSLFFSSILSVVTLFSTLEWGPENRFKFDELKEKILWSNFSNMLNDEGEISINLNKNRTERSEVNLGSFLGEDSTQTNKITISVASIEDKKWRNLRITFFDNQDKIQTVLNSKFAFVEKLTSKGQLKFDLHYVDIESIDKDNEFYSGGSDLFISVKHLNEPLIFQISKGNTRDIKRIGFFELLKITNSNNHPQKEDAKAILHKNLSLGVSPFFVTLLIFPIAIRLGRKETSINLFMGILVCVLYYMVGTLLFNFLNEHPMKYAMWWTPNLLFLILFLLSLKFNST